MEIINFGIFFSVINNKLGLKIERIIENIIKEIAADYISNWYAKKKV